MPLGKTFDPVLDAIEKWGNGYIEHLTNQNESTTKTPDTYA